MKRAFVLLFAGISLVACTYSIESPEPGLDKLEPALVCTEQITTTVTVTGSQLSPMPIDTLTETPGLLLPDLVLARVAEIDGTAAPDSGVWDLDETSGTVRWYSDTTMDFDVFPDLTLEPGNYDFSAANADGQTASLPGGFTAVPPPRLDAVAPQIVCNEQMDNTMTLTGEFFLVIEGRLPSVTFTAVNNGQSLLLPTDAAADCFDLAGPTDAQSCTEVTVTIPAGALAADVYDIVVDNPAPAGCMSTEAVQMEVVPPPELYDVEPDGVCNDQMDNVFTLTGAGFLDLNGDLPTVTMGNYSAVADSIDGCAPLAGPAGGMTCTELTFTLPLGTLTPGLHSVLVTNPIPADCVSTEQVVIEIVPPPSVTDLVPPQICTDATDTVITVNGTGFLDVAGVLPNVNIGGIDYTPISAGGCVPLPSNFALTCTSLDILVPEGSYPVAGTYPVLVSNPLPADCDSTEAVDLVVTDPPEITSPTAAAPAVVCSTGGNIDVFGTGFQPGAVVEIGGVPSAQVTVDPSGTSLTALMPAGLPAGFQDLEVINPDGCFAFQPAAVEVVIGPVLFFVDPPVVYSGITVEASLYVSGITGSIVGVWMVEDATGARTDLTYSYDPAFPNVILAEVPAGFPEGDYTVFIEDDSGCTPFLDNAVYVEDDLEIAVESLSPPFAWTGDVTPVDIRATDPPPPGFVQFQNIPRVYLNPDVPGPGTVATILRSVTFQSNRLLNAVIPEGLPPDVYDLIVINPDGTIGLLDQALLVTDLAFPPPFVDSASPARVDTGGGPVTLQGSDFRNPTVEAICDDGGNITTTPLTPTASDATSATVNWPGGNEGTVCVARVINDDGTYYDYAAITLGSPSGNLFGFSAGAPMLTPRRAPVAEAGRATNTARYLYAIGGDSGSAASAMDSIEVVPVDFFGNMGTWRSLPGALPAPRTLAASTRMGRYIYVVGGNDGVGEVDTVLRAQVLDPLETPRFGSLTINFGGGAGLDGGVWIYRIAALFGPTFLTNPDGESLAGDPIVVRIPDVPDKIHLGVSWTSVPDAVGYRIYRTPVADSGSGTEEWLADVGPVNSFNDDGSLPTDPTLIPLPNGALGEWATVATLANPVEYPCVASGLDPADPSIGYIYIAGGWDGSTARSEVNHLTVSMLSDQNHVVTGPVPSGVSLGTGRFRCGGFTLASDINSVVTPPDTWIYFGTGATGLNSSDGITQAGRIGAGGLLTNFQTVNDVSQGRAGYGWAAGNNFLMIFGGGRGNGVNTPNSGGNDSEVLFPPPQNANWNNLGGSGIQVARVLMGSTQESAVIFIVGGAGTGGVPLTSTEITNF